MTKFLYNEELSDIEKLEYFIDFVHFDVLNPVIKNGADHNGKKIISMDVLPDFQRSWEDLEANRHFEILRKGVQKIPEARIISHGLRGRNLQSKRNIIRIVWEQFQKSGGGSLFKRLLGVIEPLFDSIIIVTGVGGAIKEIKDMISENIET